MCRSQKGTFWNGFGKMVRNFPERERIRGTQLQKGIQVSNLSSIQKVCPSSFQKSNQFSQIFPKKDYIVSGTSKFLTLTPLAYKIKNRGWGREVRFSFFSGITAGLRSSQLQLGIKTILINSWDLIYWYISRSTYIAGGKLS